MDRDIERLADAFREAGEAHHQAFLDSDGEDPEWPLWYAEYLLEDLRAALGDPDLTKSRLVHLIVAAEEQRQATDPDADWPPFYARFLAAARR